MRYAYTSQAQLRAAFRAEFPTLDYRRIPDHSGKGRMYCADVRAAWVDWIDYLQRSGQISDALANRAEL